MKVKIKKVAETPKESFDKTFYIVGQIIFWFSYPLLLSISFLLIALYLIYSGFKNTFLEIFIEPIEQEKKKPFNWED